MRSVPRLLKHRTDVSEKDNLVSSNAGKSFEPAKRPVTAPQPSKPTLKHHASSSMAGLRRPGTSPGSQRERLSPSPCSDAATIRPDKSQLNRQRAHTVTTPCGMRAHATGTNGAAQQVSLHPSPGTISSIESVVTASRETDVQQHPHARRIDSQISQPLPSSKTKRNAPSRLRLRCLSILKDDNNSFTLPAVTPRRVARRVHNSDAPTPLPTSGRCVARTLTSWTCKLRRNPSTVGSERPFAAADRLLSQAGGGYWDTEAYASLISTPSREAHVPLLFQKLGAPSDSSPPPSHDDKRPLVSSPGAVLPGSGALRGVSHGTTVFELVDHTPVSSAFASPCSSYTADADVASLPGSLEAEANWHPRSFSPRRSTPASQGGGGLAPRRPPTRRAQVVREVAPDSDAVYVVGPSWREAEASKTLPEAEPLENAGRQSRNEHTKGHRVSSSLSSLSLLTNSPRLSMHDEDAEMQPTPLVASTELGRDFDQPGIEVLTDSYGPFQRAGTGWDLALATDAYEDLARSQPLSLPPSLSGSPLVNLLSLTERQCEESANILAAAGGQQQHTHEPLPVRSRRQPRVNVRLSQRTRSISSNKDEVWDAGAFGAPALCAR